VIRTLVTGYGYWGSVLTRNLLEHPDYFVAGVHDPSPERRAVARAANLYTFRTLSDALDFTTPQLVVIASPIGLQVDAAMMALSRHANVMIAKPGAMNLDELRRIDSLAKRKKRVAVIDYTMRHAWTFQQMRDESASWGNILEVTAERFAVGSRSTAPILYDMMVHDIALLHALGDHPWRVRSVDRGHHHLHAWLDTDWAVATLTARTDADEQHRYLRLVCSGGDMGWDQLADEPAPAPVQRSLSDLARRINAGDHDMTLEYRVIATLEDIEAA
jgi:predicted dehydrogenase